jgi:hypothetical protein
MTKVQMDKIVELIREGWESREVKYIHDMPPGSATQMTKGDEIILVLPDGTIKKEEKEP